MGESWELSGLPGNVSVVSEGEFKGQTLNHLISKYKDVLVGKSVFEKHGENFPLLIKFIDAADDLSVQVHPNDETAQKLYGQNGKNELWYIIDSDRNSELILGLNKALNTEEFRNSINKNTLTEHLNTVKIKKGDVSFIPAGRIHAIKKGVLLAEIQQSSDITYRIYDWNRKGLDGKYRKLHIDEACKVAELKTKKSYLTKYSEKINMFVQCVSNKYFSVNLLKFNTEIVKNYSETDSFIIFICTKGSFRLMYSENEIKVSFGETVLLPAVIKKIKLIPDKESELLEVFI
ncbi:MAG: mannose-6-phosphate isomerase [Bacteroidales bacterium]|nr:mannose-6-phosphate isomerase [Bacteroidales bacterium]